MVTPKPFTLAAVALVGGLAVAPAARAEFKVGFVDQRRAIISSDGGKQAEKTLSALAESKKGEIKPQEKIFTTKREELEAQKFVLSKEALQEKQIELEKMRRDLERGQTAAIEDLEIEQNKLLAPIVKRFAEAVSVVGKEKGFDLILDRSSPGILYYEDGLDVTDLVIKRLNAN